MSELPQAHLTPDKIVLIGNEAISVYNRGYYGLPGSEGVILSSFEALHLLELGRIEIVDDDQQHPKETDLIQRFSSSIMDFMSRYLVYKDLRNRGYVVNQGSGSSFFFRLYLRGHIPKRDSASFYIIPLQEGKSINLDELDELVKIAGKSNKELVLGLVDASGDVSYLKVNQLYPKALENKEFSDFSSWDWEKVWKDYISWEN